MSTGEKPSNLGVVHGAKLNEYLVHLRAQRPELARELQTRIGVIAIGELRRLVYGQDRVSDPGLISLALEMSSQTESPGSWLGRSACASVPFDTHFPEEGQSTINPLLVCANCPVLPDCLFDSFQNDGHNTHGMTSALKPTERAIIKRESPNDPNRAYSEAVRVLFGKKYPPSRTRTNKPLLDNSQRYSLVTIGVQKIINEDPEKAHKLLAFGIENSDKELRAALILFGIANNLLDPDGDYGYDKSILA
ncbi:MAG: WhiB family transcriptional regulator [Patescibacteria group bacterium]|jgi:hypothetical protein|nr:WhiB family transcriptional regulator [Patescibacteria group bacterium]